MGVEKPRVQEQADERPPPPERPADDEDEADDERVRARVRGEEGRDEAPQRAVLAARVVDPVLGKPGQALVVQSELLAVPAGNAGLAPGLELDERQVDETDDRDPGRDERDDRSDAAPVAPPDGRQPAERVAGDRQEVVPEREELPARRRLAAEPVLRDHRVQDDDERVAHREHVRRHGAPTTAHLHGDDDERDEEQRLLPGGDGVQRSAANAELPELREERVVEREPDEQRGEREPREPLSRQWPPA